jgi:hypothetical protein
MATFRSSVLVLALLGLACAPRESSDAPPPAAAEITRQQIDHLAPRRDFVGPAPARLEWTAVDGVETYNITVVTEIDSVVFQHTGARGTALEWPQEIALEPGTYFWRIVALRGDRVVADSGRAAFVVRE